jgi:hypothetical protein
MAPHTQYITLCIVSYLFIIYTVLRTYTVSLCISEISQFIADYFNYGISDTSTSRRFPIIFRTEKKCSAPSINYTPNFEAHFMFLYSLPTYLYYIFVLVIFIPNLFTFHDNSMPTIACYVSIYNRCIKNSLLFELKSFEFIEQTLIQINVLIHTQKTYSKYLLYIKLF